MILPITTTPFSYQNISKNASSHNDSLYQYFNLTCCDGLERVLLAAARLTGQYP